MKLKLSAYKFAINRNSPDAHGQLFQFFKDKNIVDFTENKLVFIASESFILVRCSKEIVGIPSVNEVVELNDKIKGNVLLSTLVQKRFYSNGSSTQKYVNLSENKTWLNEHITNLLEKAGLKNIKFTYSRSSGVLALQKIRKTLLPVIDVEFEADIENASLLEKSWLNGIGRQKTYGLGMLRVMRND